MAVEFVERNKSGEFLFDVVRGNYLLGWIHSTGYEAYDDTILYADELRAIADKLEELERDRLLISISRLEGELETIRINGDC